MEPERPQVRKLSGGRLQLLHGPIDVVLCAWGEPAAVESAYKAVSGRFGSILAELCAELPLLRAPVGSAASPAADPDSSLLRKGEGDPGHTQAVHPGPTRLPRSPVAQRMVAACLPFADVFITPMAAVAGSVADELLAVMLAAAELERAYVNDGGDIAVYCAPGMTLDIGIAGGFAAGPVPQINGRLHIGHDDGVRGIATSGARGRSFTLGIADSVTVLAADAATADAAATLIANAVAIDHPAIIRRPASALSPDSDLGDRLVTVSVGALPRQAVLAALEAGRRRAADYLARGLIVETALMLQGEAVSPFAGDAGWVGRSDDPKCSRRVMEPVGSAVCSTQPRPEPTEGIGPRGTEKAGRAATEGMSL
jgi:hypothetical protein